MNKFILIISSFFFLTPQFSWSEKAGKDDMDSLPPEYHVLIPTEASFLDVIKTRLKTKGENLFLVSYKVEGKEPFGEIAVLSKKNRKSFVLWNKKYPEESIVMMGVYFLDPKEPQKPFVVFQKAYSMSIGGTFFVYRWTGKTFVAVPEAEGQEPCSGFTVEDLNKDGNAEIIPYSKYPEYKPHIYAYENGRLVIKDDRFPKYYEKKNK
jgi:hypothetical protein